jgi:hypothetical protein
MASLLKQLVNLGTGKYAERKELREWFDEAYYLTQYPEIRESGMNALDHFMSVGWQEGKNPSPKFNVSFYLQQYPDVKASGMNPLRHYIKNGKAEGREPAPPFEGVQGQQPDKVSADDMDAVKPHFDAAYYLAMYEDVRNAGLNPLNHYMSTGWREYRNPSANFNTATYLQLNQDVRNAGVNPLVHYAYSGLYEDRIIKLRCLEELKVLHQKFKAEGQQSSKVSVTVEPIRKLEELFHHLNSEPMVVAISHDDYLANIGGVQVFLREEEEKFRDSGYVYVHLSPISTGGTPELGRDYIRVIVDRGAPAVFLFEDVVRVLGGLAGKRSLMLIIHSLINSVEEHVVDGLLTVPWSKKYHWIHDYSLLCGEFNLLRNGVQWCGFPSADSAACFTCAGFKSRQSKKLMAERFVREGFQFVAPSDAARDVVANSGLIPGSLIHVVNHVNLIDRGASLRRIRGKGDAVRVAYCGHPVFHKGWGVFQQVVEFTAVSGDYRFYHLGVHDTHMNATEFVTVRNTADSRDSMINAIRDHEIDIVIVAAQWAETFCYVAYEALLGGALVFTTELSGNVAALASKMPHVVSFSTNQELIDAFSSGKACDIALTVFDAGLPAFDATYQGTTAALETAHAE